MTLKYIKTIMIIIMIIIITEYKPQLEVSRTTARWQGRFTLNGVKVKGDLNLKERGRRRRKRRRRRRRKRRKGRKGRQDVTV